MSKRETTLCDVESSNWNNNSITCSELAIAMCVLCRRDVCKLHTLHPQGGVLLRADSIIPGNVQHTNQDLIYAPASQQITPYPQVGYQTPMIRLQVCTGCRKQLNDTSIQECLRAMQTLFIELLGSTIAAKALEAKK